MITTLPDVECFCSGAVLVLCATEVVGIVCTHHSNRQQPNAYCYILDIDNVVQFMTPEALLTWIQCAGHAGQDRQPSWAILLVEPSVAKRFTPKSSSSSKCSKNTGKGDIYSAFTCRGCSLMDCCCSSTAGIQA